MDALSAAYDSNSSGGEGDEGSVQEMRKDEISTLDAEESSSILSRLKEKFPLNSAPSVPVRVSPSGQLLETGLSMLLHVRVYAHCALQESADDLLRVGPDTKEVTYNPTVDQLYAPEVSSQENTKQVQIQLLLLLTSLSAPGWSS